MPSWVFMYGEMVSNPVRDQWQSLIPEFNEKDRK